MNQKVKEINEQRDNLIKREKPSCAKLEFTLVIVMLSSLTFIIVLLILFPIVIVNCFENKTKDYAEFIDYSKWVLTALLAAFGAWIGAGAAYFFGKENLRLSSESTENALIIQKGLEKVQSTIRDIKPTPLNPDFTFSFDTYVEDVIKKLRERVDYWFVPIIENERLKDTIHEKAFRQYKDEEHKGKKISDLINYIKTSKKFVQIRNRFHKFFVEVSMDDSVHEVSSIMNEKNADVGIVCDKNNKPTHCFSRRDLRLFERGNK